MKGEKILEKNNLADLAEINVSFLLKGFYFVILDRSSQKLIIE